MGTTFSHLGSKTVPFNPQVQVESNTPQDFAALALQIQTLTTSVEELTR